jgi:hypothetical protein
VANILIIHGFEQYPLRSTIRDHLFCFKKYLPDDKCFYLNLNENYEVPDHIKKLNFDLILFHTVFVAARWSGEAFFEKNVIEKCKVFKDHAAVKIVLPQDEWIHTVSLNRFINEVNVDMILSVSPSTEWKKIYNEVDLNKVSIHKMLTGYIDDELVKKIKKLEEKNSSRPIDIGYRAFKSPAWLGRHGFLKTKIADVFSTEKVKSKFKTDISTDLSATITGDKWYEFMLQCKYFIGVEGGSTILDPKGEIWEKGNEFVRKNPNASFEEIEKECFPGMDGNLRIIALSPRHLETCITNTCQVLIEGEYDGALTAGRNYIELKADFSNLDEVLVKMKDEELRKKIVKQTYEDVVASGKYSYSAFSKFVIGCAQTSLKWQASPSGIKDSIELLSHQLKEKRKIRKLRRKKSMDEAKYKIKDFYKYTVLPRIQTRISKLKVL